MNHSSIVRRAATLAGAAALASFASVSHADPISLTGQCIMTSLVAGQSQCSLLATMRDDFTAPAVVRKAQIKINGVLVTQAVNDSVTPVGFFATGVSGSMTVACGASYNVAGFIMRQGANNYEQVGHLPAVACPAAPQ
ncbi:hypothetical protein AACH06_15080 [Ideonella sp. DXS29W]|uniref:Uncharacterized protein n=1 Tax=Ideonella lacteola TaxID=2984193 RepID=A0ABU9BQW3_9BURK